MTRDLKAAYRSDEPMTLDERAEAQRLIVTEYRAQQAAKMPGGRPPHPLEVGPLGYGAYIIGTRRRPVVRTKQEHGRLSP